ncbi:RsmD family RNA methyltransferase [Gemmatimonas sp.]|uniref:class I SAM-dependent RNA methyltransferase n=1 Tax=Gemmatimonas sp. TaxID=1962908 RepID=UPI00286E9B96|nr:RsmD family RNA methyltransferase [Gemmatimonas sp.]
MSEKPAVEEIATLTIDRIAKGGDGVGRANGLACFVPRTAPGDVAQVAYVAHARHGRGRVLQIVAPSAHRVDARCAHYERDRCGGCQLQHLDDEAQRDARRHIVQDALSRIGKRTIELPELITGESWGYRGRLTLMLLPRGRGWTGGLHPHDDAARVFNLQECPIANPVLVQCWRDMRERLHGMPTDRFLRVSFRLLSAESGQETVAVVVQGGEAWSGAAEWAAALLRASAPVRAVWWLPRGGEPVGLAGDVNTDVAMLGAALQVESATSDGNAALDEAAEAGRYVPDAREALAFAQVNSTVATALRDFVYASVQSFSPKRVVDAYAGSGELTERFARDGAQVVSIEADASGTAATRRRVDEAGLTDRVQVITALVESALSAALPADVVVLNPPRAGVAVGVTSLLEQASSRGVRGIVYVSCDPATLARDLARVPGWRIDAVRCFDMFPQTAHVETVCVLRPETTA